MGFNSLEFNTNIGGNGLGGNGLCKAYTQYTVKLRPNFQKIAQLNSYVVFFCRNSCVVKGTLGITAKESIHEFGKKHVCNNGDPEVS